MRIIVNMPGARVRRAKQRAASTAPEHGSGTVPKQAEALGAAADAAHATRPAIAYNGKLAVSPDIIARRRTIPFEGTDVVVAVRKVDPKYAGRVSQSVIYCVEAGGKLHPISDEAFILRFVQAKRDSYSILLR